MTHQHNVPRCSFCNRGGNEVKRLIAGPRDVHICNECVVLCSEILDEEASQEVEQQPFVLERVPPPKEIAAQLDQYVIGQQKA